MAPSRCHRYGDPLVSENEATCAPCRAALRLEIPRFREFLRADIARQKRREEDTP